VGSRPSYPSVRKGVNPTFILDAATGRRPKTRFLRVPVQPARGEPGARLHHVGQPPAPTKSGVPVPGYYNLPDRAQRLDALLRTPDVKWNSAEARKLQLDVTNDYGPRIRRNLLPVMDVRWPPTPTTKPSWSR